MPEAFDKCVKQGGRVRTKSLSGSRFIRICFDSKGKSHAGEIKTSHEASMRKRANN